MRTRLTSAFVALTLVGSGCASMPRDPDGTLDRVKREGVLRVGASPSERTALEEDLARGLAAELGARVQLTRGGETALVGAMERGELDLLVGGLHADSPWSDKVSITRAYAESTEAGETVKHVLAVPLGENAMLARVETFLDEATP